MLGKDRFQFESPNAIDAGEAPPTAPGRKRGSGRRGWGGGSGHSGTRSPGTRSPRSVAAPQAVVAKGERLFRGTKIEIKNNDDDDDGSADVESPQQRRCSISTTGSFEGSMEMEFYSERGGGGASSVAESDYSERPVHDQLPSPDEARMYAAAILTESFRRLNDSDSEEDAAMAAEALAANEEGRLLSSSAIGHWHRPSRRKKHLAERNALSIRHKEQTQRSCLYFSTTICCSVLLISTVVAFIVVICVVYLGGNGNDAAATLTTTPPTGSQDDAAAPPPVTEMVNSPRFLKTIQWLEEHGISTMKDLTTEDSPQYQAARWIADLDRMQSEIPVLQNLDKNHLVHNASAEEQDHAHQVHMDYERFLQRYILAVFFFSLNGRSWVNDLSFLSENNECAWFDPEIANDGQSYALGVTCNNKLFVQDLFVPRNNLVGNLPSEIQFLRHLELLSVRHNFVKSTIPPELARLSDTLQYLDLTKNDMTGSLSGSVMGSLTGLKALGLAGNHFEGSIPAELSGLSNLITLDLSHNRKLKGPINPVVGSLTDLKYLYLENNQFEDKVDDSFMLHLRHLSELTLNDNKFTSDKELPFHLISHQNLTLLDLSNNGLAGSLPNTFLSTSNTNSQLKVLNLARNQLTGTVPLAIQMLSQLQFIDLSKNAFNGPIPVSLGNMKGLTHAYLGENNFDPNAIPPVFFTDSNLQVLSLPSTQLTGQVRMGNLKIRV